MPLSATRHRFSQAQQQTPTVSGVCYTQLLPKIQSVQNVYSPALKNRWDISSPYAFAHANVRVLEVNLMYLTLSCEVFNVIVFDFKHRLAGNCLEGPRLLGRPV